MVDVYLFLVLITFIASMAATPELHQYNAITLFFVMAAIAFLWPVFWSVVIYCVITGKEF